MQCWNALGQISLIWLSTPFQQTNEQIENALLKNEKHEVDDMSKMGSLCLVLTLKIQTLIMCTAMDGDEDDDELDGEDYY